MKKKMMMMMMMATTTTMMMPESKVIKLDLVLNLIHVSSRQLK